MQVAFFLIILCNLLSLIGATIPGVPLSNRKTFMEGLTGLTLVEFYSPHCGHCHKYTETLRRVATTIPTDPHLSRIRFEQFSCKGGPWCRELGLQRIPTLRLYNEDELIGELEGQQKYATIISWLRKATEYVPLPRPSVLGPQVSTSNNQTGCTSSSLSPTCPSAHTFGMSTTSSGRRVTPTLTHAIYSIVTGTIPHFSSTSTPLSMSCGQATYSTPISLGSPSYYDLATTTIYGPNSIGILDSYGGISSQRVEVYGNRSYSSLPSSMHVSPTLMSITLTSSIMEATSTPTSVSLRAKNRLSLKHH